MPAARRFRVDSRKVVHETIDGETILIQLDTGTYYSLLGTGAAIWELASSGRSTAAIVAELQRRYGANAATVKDATEGLLGQLLDENLIELDPDRNGAERDGAPPGLGENGQAEFVPPVLERYTDMQYFLLLDPIHEADEEAGWPNRPEEVGDGEGVR